MITSEDSSSVEAAIRNAVAETVRINPRQGRPDPGFRPRMDLKDTKREFVAYIDLPGIDEDELRFTWDKDALCIAGCRDFNHDVEDAEEFVQLQRIYGDFVCEIPLNDSLDVANATAKYKRGVLAVRIPKR